MNSKNNGLPIIKYMQTLRGLLIVAAVLTTAAFISCTTDNTDEISILEPLVYKAISIKNIKPQEILPLI